LLIVIGYLLLIIGWTLLYGATIFHFGVLEYWKKRGIHLQHSITPASQELRASACLNSP
jgi:hypothetical protein